MSTQTEECLFEAEDERTPSEQALLDYQESVGQIDPVDVLAVICDRIRAQEPRVLMALIREQMTDPYPSWNPHVHPDTAQEVTVAWIQSIREALDDLANQKLYAEARQ